MAKERLTIGGLDLDTPGIPIDPVAVAVGFRSKQLARDREAYCRQLLEARMPRRLHWLIDRPRTLKRVMRLVPRWRPTLTIVALSRPSHPLDPPAHMRPPADEMARTWKAEMRAQGHDVPSGLVFTYTGVDGLPAEVYS